MKEGVRVQITEQTAETLCVMKAKAMEQAFTILVIDDDPASVNTVSKALHAAGFRTMAAPGGERALRQLELVQPDLILLDVLMPDIDGFETCRRLKHNPRTAHIPIIFMTALSDTIDKLKGFEAGGVDYLTKPVQHDEMLARIRLHVQLRQFQQQLEQQNIRLEEQNQRFRILTEATFEGILIHDGENILELNQRLETMFGYPRSEALGKPVLEFVAPESQQLIAARIRAQDEMPYEAEGRRKDGSHFPIAIQAKTMPYQGREVRVAAVRDLSWQKHIEREKAQLEKENITLRSTLQDRYKFGNIIGKSAVMQAVYQVITKASASDANVVIYGESGTGKELVAQTIHAMSDRRQQAFVEVNCGAVPETLFEREFFGHRKGAFTGADRNTPGYFDRAHGGTLFLDEIGELSPAMQVKLLRVLDSGEYIPVGGNAPKKVDTRIIAATHQHLKELVRQDLMREDFFYRIHVLALSLPPLRDRKEDISLMVDYFLKQYGDSRDCTTIPTAVLKALCAYSWPGNVRELQNELQRYLAEQRLEFMGDLKDDAESNSRNANLAFEQDGFTFREATDAYEKYLLATILEQQRGNIADTAKALDLPLRTVYRKLHKYQIV